ncbi:MAG: hypothetical protein NZ455_06285 [Bacteroidia bacterium]|nr:hypothetical protein [Bacteroidia bacterium]MDW8346191.1 hypothetical protein [Bacteroidia bacterium]
MREVCEAPLLRFHSCPGGAAPLARSTPTLWHERSKTPERKIFLSKNQDSIEKFTTFAS